MRNSAKETIQRVNSQKLVSERGSFPSLSGYAQSGKLPKKKGERVRRQRLVSYSSQESQDSDGAGSRKSSRKLTAVTKFGGVMIDSIFKSRRNKGEGDRERDTNWKDKTSHDWKRRLLTNSKLFPGRGRTIACLKFKKFGSLVKISN